MIMKQVHLIQEVENLVWHETYQICCREQQCKSSKLWSHTPDLDTARVEIVSKLYFQMMMIAFITFKSSLVPLLEGL